MGISLLLLLLLLLLSPPILAADLFSLVYKGCASNGGGALASQQSISALATSLISQSASSTFFKTTSSSSTGQQIFGLFQCRGDLSNNDCAACVQHLLPMWSSLCGNSAAAARVQLTGCYALYQVSGFPQVSGTQMLFKKCGSGGSGNGFEEKRDTAFANLQSGMAGAKGFYATSYQSVYAMAQCEGDLSTADCGTCVTQAVQKAEVECGGASSGQVYLDKCYITYNYYPDGVPYGGIEIGGGVGGGGGGGGWLLELHF